MLWLHANKRPTLLLVPALLHHDLRVVAARVALHAPVLDDDALVAEHEVGREPRELGLVLPTIAAHVEPVCDRDLPFRGERDARAAAVLGPRGRLLKLAPGEAAPPAAERSEEGHGRRRPPLG